jgi:serine/threonine protein kinase
VDRIGKYEIRRLVARGGMGALYLANDPDLDREVAVKVMSEDIMSDEQGRARFYREAKAAARLQHRNIVTVFDFAHDGDVPYIVMEFLRGQNLADRLRSGPPFTLPATLDLTIQLCEGLHFAHGEGVVHRDVKPANIWVLPDGSVKLLDFGIAKLATSTLTAGTAVVGSAAYMSPEQIEGQPVDARSDLFSVGAVLFELVAGQPAFDGRSVTAVMMKITQDEPAPDVRTAAPDTPAALASVIARALQKSPDDRYSDAAEMVTDLRIVRLDLADVDERSQTALARSRDPEQPTWHQDAPKPVATIGSPVVVFSEPTLPVQRRQEDKDSQDNKDTGAADHRYDVFRPSEEDVEAPQVAATPAAVHSSSSWRWRWVVLAALAITALASVLFFSRLQPTKSPPLQVTSSPEGARIIVGGQDTGLHTPADVRIERLPVDIRLEMAGYEPFLVRVTEQQFGTESGRRVTATLAESPKVSPPTPEVQSAPPPPAMGELSVLRTPAMFTSCSAIIGRAWKGHPFDGVTTIRLPPQKYAITIECEDQPPVRGVIEVPSGKIARDFKEVVTLEP